jgi:proteasome activator subunit 4
LQVARATWSGLGTFWQEQPKTVVNPCVDAKTEIESLLVTPLNVKAGFTLSDPQDPRYQMVLTHRTRFGEVLNRAAIFLQGEHAGEDHIDAVMAVLKAIDVHALEYGMTRSSYDSLRKNYGQARE